jgi:3'(2'), 5'-bisphosphate nucleotidase
MVVSRTRPAKEALAVAEAIGADGSPLRYNRADTYMPDLLICRPEHAALVLDAMARACA